MGFRELRRDLPIEEFDYQLLISYLEEYAKPRSKIQRLIRDNKIIRVKKGLYIFGPDYRKGSISKESLANLIYGPSYISYQYALSYYGMIPERTETVTSATTGKTKQFHTPAGTFSYRHVESCCYAVGVTLLQLDEYHASLIATPEKALVDQLIAEKGLDRSYNVEEYLYEDLRIEPDFIARLNSDRLQNIGLVCRQGRVSRLIDYFLKEFGNA